MKTIIAFLMLAATCLGGTTAFDQVTVNKLNGNTVTTGTGTLSLGSFSLTVPQSGTLGTAAFTAATAYAPATSGTAILHGNGSGGFSAVTIGSGLSFSGETLSSTVTGTMTSVALTMPSGFSVSGSPITSSGTLAVTTSLSGIVKAAAGAFTVAVNGTDYLSPTAAATSLTMATGKILGRTSALGGAVEYLTVGSGLLLTPGSGEISIQFPYDPASVDITGGSIEGVTLSATTSGVAHSLISTASSITFSTANVVSLKHTNADGASAIAALDKDGNERGAFGYKNIGPANSYLDGYIYISGGGYNPSGTPLGVTPIAIGQEGGGVTAHRIRFGDDWTIRFIKALDNTPHTTVNPNGGWLIGSAGATATTNAFDVIGPAVFGDYTVQANRNTDGSGWALGIMQTTGNVLRMIKTGVVKVDLAIAGTGGSRRLDFIDTDNGGVIPLSLSLAGTGAVTVTSISGSGAGLTNIPTSGISGLGLGVATWLGSPTFANLATAATGDTLAGSASTNVFTNKTFDSQATGNTLKLIDEIHLTHPHQVDGTGATFNTTANLATYGHASFSNSADQAGNYAVYRFRVPFDLDTATDLAASFTFRLGGSDTGKHRYVISMADIADSAGADAPTYGNAVNLDFAGDASGASGDNESVGYTTLTSWKSSLTVGHIIAIKLARDGDDGTNDTSSVNSSDVELSIKYGRAQ